MSTTFHEKPAYVNHLAKNIPASLTESETLSCFHSHSLSASRVARPGARWGPISPALQSESRPL